MSAGAFGSHRETRAGADDLDVSDGGETDARIEPSVDLRQEMAIDGGPILSRPAQAGGGISLADHFAADARFAGADVAAGGGRNEVATSRVTGRARCAPQGLRGDRQWHGLPGCIRRR
ncbi:hypothetical protein LNKW23_22450 [Paralimibaculum aggregatum]|uniref:Uncharacterized protein n=1 Tax=Paralimibaculum aggregatum TaxID=3036245 RepID=A0ABQ6LMW1_9RHOB|nr:hypothetical protein [Limibaculum sp. NKW23]GMG83032.1 hypothetical protein LNKW23_22450 [Limibaculum sp. NKW23]